MYRYNPCAMKACAHGEKATTAKKLTPHRYRSGNLFARQQATLEHLRDGRGWRYQDHSMIITSSTDPHVLFHCIWARGWWSGSARPPTLSRPSRSSLEWSTVWKITRSANSKDNDIAMTVSGKDIAPLTELHEIRLVKHPSMLDQWIQLTGRTTILNPSTTIADILEKNLMLDFRLRATLRVS